MEQSTSQCAGPRRLNSIQDQNVPVCNGDIFLNCWSTQKDDKFALDRPVLHMSRHDGAHPWS